MKVTISVSNRTVLRVVLLILALLLFFTLLKKATHALTLIFIAGFLAVALNAPVHWLSQRLPGRRKGSRGAATGIAFLIVVLLLVSLLWAILPPLARQTASFVSEVPQYVQDAHDTDTGLGRFIDRYHLEGQLDKLSSDLSGRLQSASGTILDTFTTVTSSLIAILTVLVLTYMMLVEGPVWIKLGFGLMKDNEREHVEILLAKMYRVITGYVNGQLLLASIAAIFMLVPFMILGINYPVALAVIVFFAGLIPMVGHTFGAVIVSIAALFTSPFAALIVLGYYFLYQQIENVAIQPRIQANTTDMTPLMVFGSVLIGVSFASFLGGLLSIPIAACLRILVLDYIERNHSGRLKKQLVRNQRKAYK